MTYSLAEEFAEEATVVLRVESLREASTALRELVASRQALEAARDANAQLVEYWRGRALVAEDGRSWEAPSIDLDSWVQTHSGRRVSVLRPDPATIDFGDVAHSLARQCRFNGHVRDFYSVAQHCALACDMAGPEEWDSTTREDMLGALLHDAHEAYVGDVVSPVKWALGDAVRRIEAAFDRAIVAAALVPGLSALRLIECMRSPAMKQIDLRLLATEKRDLMAVQRDDWDPMPEPFDARIDPWSPERAEAEWLARFRGLTECTRR